MAVDKLELESRPPLTVEEFEALAEQQGWDEDTPVELLDGELVWMSPTNDPHIGCVNRLNRLFHRRFPDDLVLVSVQNPVRVGPYDEPEPDIALLKPRTDDYGRAKATPPDILLLVEVADKTLRTDLGRKARIYAGSSVPEYWVVDLSTRTFYVHREPVDGAYRLRLVLEASAELSAAFAPAVQFTVDEILG
jgi:Uma2 family endonuclease